MQVERRTGKVRWPKTNVPPLSHGNNDSDDDDDDDVGDGNSLVCDCFVDQKSRR